MNHFFIFLGNLESLDLLNAQRDQSNTNLYEWLAFLGGIIIAVVIAAAWAIPYSKRAKKHKHRHHRHYHEETKDRALNFRDPNEPSHGGSGRRRMRRQRRPHRPMNPTLAQTGGLPPMRDENTPLPPMP